MLTRTIVVFLLLASLAVPARAHSLDDVQADLSRQEPHVEFEPGIGTPFPDFKLTDPDGLAVALHALRGKVVVLDFTYGHCTALCPAQDARIKDIQKDVAAGHMADRVRFISVSVDPDRDTPVFRKEYAVAHGFDSANWTFVTAETGDDARALARSAGATFVRAADGSFDHSAITYVIDDDGKLRARFLGVDFSPLNAVIYINALVNDPHYRPEAATSPETAPPSLWTRIKSYL
jgi:protein SCO1/2